MQRSFRFAVLLVLGLLIGPAGAQEAPSSPQAGPCAPGAVYDPACDVDHDGDVDIFDVQLAAGHWNQTGVWTGGDYWALGGNAGTTPGTHFLGTTDDQPLDVRVSGSRALLIVVQGLAQVKVARGEAVTPGQRLKASNATGEARGLRTVEVDGVTLDEGGPTVGVALDAAEDGMVWVMVALQ